MIYKYIRFSTDKQDQRQQENAIDSYLDNRGMSSLECKTFMDEGVSGGVSYKKRNLFKLANEIKEGDTIIVSELSRLTRGGIVELSSMIDEFFKPQKVNLIICNTAMTIDCANINAMTEMMLSNLASFAKMEKESIQERTKSALEARRKIKELNGGFTNKKGSFVTGFGAASETYCGGNTERKEEILNKARLAASKAKKERALANPYNKKFIAYFKGNELKKKSDVNWNKISDVLNSIGLRTSTGLEFNKNRALAMFNKLKMEII